MLTSLYFSIAHIQAAHSGAAFLSHIHLSTLRTRSAGSLPFCGLQLCDNLRSVLDRCFVLSILAFSTWLRPPCCMFRVPPVAFASAKTHDQDMTSLYTPTVATYQGLSSSFAGSKPTWSKSKSVTWSPYFLCKSLMVFLVSLSNDLMHSTLCHPL